MDQSQPGRPVIGANGSQSFVELLKELELWQPAIEPYARMTKETHTDHQPLSWFALRVRSNYERIASTHLRERGFEDFSPSYQVQRRWSDRTKTMEQFLFPGYVFSRLNPHDRLHVVTVPGVVGLVGFGKMPTAIPDQEIESIRTMLRSGLLMKPWPFLEVGQRVLIERGPLAGVEGILQDVKGRFRLVVSISLLQRSVSAEIDRTWVRPISSTPSKQVLLDRPCAL
jgi:transcription antitermination factor NusG